MRKTLAVHRNLLTHYRAMIHSFQKGRGVAMDSERSCAGSNAEPILLWDPLRRFGDEGRWIWLTLALWASVIRGSGTVAILSSSRGETLVWRLGTVAAFSVSIYLTVRCVVPKLSLWTFAPVLFLMIFCDPYQRDFAQLHRGSFLLLALVMVWNLERSGYLRTAGILLGIASAVGYLPLTLLFYYGLRRKWSLLGSSGSCARGASRLWF
jgi:hypothetical protein